MGLAFERHGSGPPLVLLHGVGHRRQAWGAVLERLTPHRDVVLVDLPGHGESPPLRTSGRPVVDAVLDPVLELLDELGLDRPHFAGNSLGGRLSLEAGVKGRAATVTALSPAGFWSGNRAAGRAWVTFKIMEFAAARTQRLAPALSRSTAGRALVYGAIVSRPSRVSPEQTQGDMAAFLAARPALDEIIRGMTQFTGHVPADVPVTIGWGTRDRLLAPRQALVAKARVPQARLTPLPGCGHAPMTDDPELVADVLLRGSAVQAPTRELTDPSPAGA
jgi:pimeloyl-ACP methyl ester carboxylesterase